MVGLYQLFLFILLITAGPFLLLSKKARAGLFQKFGFVPRSLQERVAAYPADCRRVWFHAVSVGEFNALFPLLQEFHGRYPDYKIFVSTTTRTGQELAKSRASEFAEIFYFPFDLPFPLSSWLDLIRPELVGIVETEIWPAFMSECCRRGVKVVLLNGRLSPRSYKGYMRFSWFFGPVVRMFSALAVQSEAEKQRFQGLLGSSVAELPIEVCGNIKLDGLKPCNAAETVQLQDRLGLKDELVLVAGSTHEGEEAAMLAALKKLDMTFRLILVPRHPERFDRVAQIIEAAGFRSRRFSRAQSFEKPGDVYLLDTIGQLSKFYSLAHIAFVGGTLANIGGHNLAEPCVYKVPVICGPYIHKARDLYQRLSECKALEMVQDETELISLLKLLLEEAPKRRELGENGHRFLLESQGALAKTLSMLEKYLDVESSRLEPKFEALAGGGGR